MQQLLTYTNTFADVHNLDLLFGHEMYNRAKSYGLYGSKTMMFSPDNTELGAAPSSTRRGRVRRFWSTTTRGYFFRGQYDYDNRIYFSGSYRRDASSSTDHRWGNFWSLGAAWIINRESWFNASWVNMLKVKASYGSQGNDNLGSRAGILLPLYRLPRDPEQRRRRYERTLPERQPRHHLGRPTPTSMSA